MLVNVSEAIIRELPRTRRQLFVAYPGGLELWLNDHPSENWRICAEPSAGRSRLRAVPGGGTVWPASGMPTLPPAGWAAFTRDGTLFSFSALDGSNRVDYVRSPGYIYLDGRGHWFDAPEAAADGALAIRPLGKDRLEIIRISGAGAFIIRRPYQVRGACVAGEAFDVEGRRLAAPGCQDAGTETRITPIAGAVRYVLRFAARR